MPTRSTLSITSTQPLEANGITFPKPDVRTLVPKVQQTSVSCKQLDALEQKGLCGILNEMVGHVETELQGVMHVGSTPHPEAISFIKSLSRYSLKIALQTAKRWRLDPALALTQEAIRHNEREIKKALEVLGEIGATASLDRSSRVKVRKAQEVLSEGVSSFETKPERGEDHDRFSAQLGQKVNEYCKERRFSAALNHYQNLSLEDELYRALCRSRQKRDPSHWKASFDIQCAVENILTKSGVRKELRFLEGRPAGCPEWMIRYGLLSNPYASHPGEIPAELVSPDPSSKLMITTRNGPRRVYLSDDYIGQHASNPWYYVVVEGKGDERHQVAQRIEADGARITIVTIPDSYRQIKQRYLSCRSSLSDSVLTIQDRNKRVLSVDIGSGKIVSRDWQEKKGPPTLNEESWENLTPEVLSISTEGHGLILDVHDALGSRRHIVEYQSLKPVLSLNHGELQTLYVSYQEHARTVVISNFIKECSVLIDGKGRLSRARAFQFSEYPSLMIRRHLDTNSDFVGRMMSDGKICFLPFSCDEVEGQCFSRSSGTFVKESDDEGKTVRCVFLPAKGKTLYRSTGVGSDLPRDLQLKPITDIDKGYDGDIILFEFNDGSACLFDDQSGRVIAQKNGSEGRRFGVANRIAWDLDISTRKITVFSSAEVHTVVSDLPLWLVAIPEHFSFECSGGGEKISTLTLACHNPKINSWARCLKVSINVESGCVESLAYDFSSCGLNKYDLGGLVQATYSLCREGYYAEERLRLGHDRSSRILPDSVKSDYESKRLLGLVNVALHPMQDVALDAWEKHWNIDRKRIDGYEKHAMLTYQWEGVDITSLVDRVSARPVLPIACNDLIHVFTGSISSQIDRHHDGPVSALQPEMDLSRGGDPLNLVYQTCATVNIQGTFPLGYLFFVGQQWRVNLEEGYFELSKSPAQGAIVGDRDTTANVIVENQLPGQLSFTPLGSSTVKSECRGSRICFSSNVGAFLSSSVGVNVYASSVRILDLRAQMRDIDVARQLPQLNPLIYQLRIETQELIALSSVMTPAMAFSVLHTHLRDTFNYLTSFGAYRNELLNTGAAVTDRIEFIRDIAHRTSSGDFLYAGVCMQRAIIESIVMSLAGFDSTLHTGFATNVVANKAYLCASKAHATVSTKAVFGKVAVVIDHDTYVSPFSDDERLEAVACARSKTMNLSGADLHRYFAEAGVGDKEQSTDACLESSQAKHATLKMEPPVDSENLSETLRLCAELSSAVHFAGRKDPKAICEFVLSAIQVAGRPTSIAHSLHVFNSSMSLGDSSYRHLCVEALKLLCESGATSERKVTQALRLLKLTIERSLTQDEALQSLENLHGTTQEPLSSIAN